MYNIFYVIKESIENEGIFKIKSKGNTVKDKIKSLESYFFQSEFFISGIHYTKDQNENHKRKKTINEIKRLIVNSDNEYHYVSLYEVFNIKESCRNIETLNIFSMFFLLFKNAHLTKCDVDIDIGFKSNPSRLIATISTYDENKYIKELKVIEKKINDMLTNNACIKLWSSVTAKNIRSISPYVGFEIMNKTVLSLEERVAKDKILLE